VGCQCSAAEADVDRVRAAVGGAVLREHAAQPPEIRNQGWREAGRQGPEGERHGTDCGGCCGSASRGRVD
jgi:hypothetical protein